MNSDKYKKVMDEVKPSDELKDKTFKIATKQNTSFSGFNNALKLASALCIFVFVFGVVFVSKHNNNQDLPNEPIGGGNTNYAVGLPAVGSYDNLKKMLEGVDERYGGYGYVDYETKGMVEEATNSNSTNESISRDVSTTGDYSRTNTQVENVDEADIVKTDGKYVYYRNYNKGKPKITIVDCVTDEVVNTIDYTDFMPNEMYVYENYLVVIGSEYKTYNYYYEEDYVMYDRAYYGGSNVKAIVYNLSDIKNEKEERVIELEGSYLSSRMINKNFYLITSKYINSYDENKIRPLYKDYAVSEEELYVDYNDIYYFQDFNTKSYLTIGSLDITKKDKMNVESFLGAGENVYCSENNLYVTKINYDYANWRNESTTIYKLEINGPKVTLKASAEINGFINNQFSMDEFDGKLRVAITEYKNMLSLESFFEYGDLFDYDTVNSLYIFDENLKEIGKIENMAPGEEIYSVRFMGKKGYVVTFDQIDPLFVLDLADPTNPKIAGELKIPGYSSYLHPYDENHIIGIGYDTKENRYGGIQNDGMKMSMFDVTDPSNPKEMFTVSLGKYSYSDATNNHKAVMVSKERNIIALPIQGNNGKYKSEAVVYSIDLDKGFEEIGSISSKNERGYYERIERIVYAQEKYYVLSNTSIVVSKMSNFEVIKEIEL